MSDIEGLKHEIESLKGTIIHKLQDEMDKIGFFFHGAQYQGDH